MSGLYFGGKLASSLCKKDGTVWLGRYKSPALKALYRTYNGSMCDAKASGKVSSAGLPPISDQIGDRLDVVLRSFLSMLLPGSFLVGGILL